MTGQVTVHRRRRRRREREGTNEGRKNAGEARNSDGVAVRAQTWHTITAFDQKNYPTPFLERTARSAAVFLEENEKIELSMFLEFINIF